MLTKLDLTALQSLLDAGVRESVDLDFKRDYDGDNADQRRNLIEDVCAMANARGGWLLLGVEETAGAASGLPGIAVADADQFRLRVLQMLGSGLAPQLAGVQVEFVPQPSGRSVVGVRVPQSWSGPHRTTNGRRFMVRGDGGNDEYDMHGLRQAFLASDRATRAWEVFRDDRIARFYSDRLPVAVKTGPAALIHLYPLSAAAAPNAVDVYAAATAAELVFAEDAVRRGLLNVEGVVRRGDEADGASIRHVQVFRSGALEAFLALDPGVGEPGLALPWVQQTVATLLPRWLPGLAQLGVNGPYQFAVTLVGVRGLRPLKGFGEHAPWGEAAREDTLLLPSWTIEPEDLDQALLLTELQQLLHQAFGRDGRDGRNSQFFGPDGSH